MSELTLYRIALFATGGWLETNDHTQGAIARIEGRLIKRYTVRVQIVPTNDKAYRETPRKIIP